MLRVQHQLHCLRKLHLAFLSLQNAPRRAPPPISSSPNSNASLGGKGEGEDSHRGKGDGEIWLRHAEHCFAYLRQGIMCAGDTALEGPDGDGEGTWDGSGVEGWRSGHGVV